jgi:hypothetical protein
MARKIMNPWKLFMFKSSSHLSRYTTKDNTLKNSYFARTFLSVGFALGLFACPQYFILTTPDSSNQIGKGMFEAGSGVSIQVRVNVALLVFGEISLAKLLAG